MPTASQPAAMPRSSASSVVLARIARARRRLSASEPGSRISVDSRVGRPASSMARPLGWALVRSRVPTVRSRYQSRVLRPPRSTSSRAQASTRADPLLAAGRSRVSERSGCVGGLGGADVLGLCCGHRPTLTAAAHRRPAPRRAPNRSPVARRQKTRDMVDGVHRAGGASGAHRRETACDTIRCSVKQIAEIECHVSSSDATRSTVLARLCHEFRGRNHKPVVTRTALASPRGRGPGGRTRPPCRGESTT